MATVTLTAEETALWESDTPDGELFRKSTRLSAAATGISEIYADDGIWLDTIEPQED